MDSGGAYGAGKSGEPFNPVEFFKRPRTIARILSWVFGLITFGCIVSLGYGEHGSCKFNGDNNACNYGTAIGILGFIFALVFFVFDFIFPSISSAEKRKKVVIADMIVSGAFTFLFFVGFCYLTNAWAKTTTPRIALSPLEANNARASIAFSFFSILSWGGLTYLAVKSYREGSLSAFAPTYADPGAESSAPYTSFPGAADMSSPSAYQQGPFSQGGAGETPKSEYQPPNY